MKFKSITLEEIEAVWGNANFGSDMNKDKMNVIKSGLLKYASGYNTGSTVLQILQDLGLVTKYRRLSKRGMKQLWEFSVRIAIVYKV